MKKTTLTIITLFFTLLASQAEEGMWTYDNLPLKDLKEKYSFTPTKGWLDSLRLSSVRFMNGGSGAFISPDGLVITNFHVAFEEIQKLSSQNNNYVENGFHAGERKDELKFPDLEVNVLISMENITDKIVKAAPLDGVSAEANKSRKDFIARLEAEENEKNDQLCNIIELYNGGEYWLYKYKTYNDIRLVASPERQLAFFGGDYDNFTYPRWNLDFTICRIYENGKPVSSPYFLKINPEGPKENDLVFVSGNPGTTKRLLTYDHLVYERDNFLPALIKYLEVVSDVIKKYSALGAEQKRSLLDQSMIIENSKKVYICEYQGLLNPAIMQKKKAEENDFRRRIASKPGFQKKYGGAFDLINKAMALKSGFINRSLFLKYIESDLIGVALEMVEYAVMKKKSDAGDEGINMENVDGLKHSIISAKDFMLDYEKMLVGELIAAFQTLSPKDSLIKQLIGNKNPQVITNEMFTKSQLANADFRKDLIIAGAEAIDSSTDPLLVFARVIYKAKKESDEFESNTITSIDNPAKEMLANARFAVYGKETYPDATFTLRLNYGTVKGYAMNGTLAPWRTTMYGLIDRSLSFDGAGDFALTAKLNDMLHDGKSNISLSTTVNFCTTNDVTGGNSGSPLVNRKMEYVGLIFDGNIESIVGTYIYNMESNRTLVVHPAYIIEALRKIYKADKVVKEMLGEK